MPIPGKFLPAPPPRKFELRHWRPPPFRSRKGPSLPSAIRLSLIQTGGLDIPLQCNSDSPSSSADPGGYTSLRELIASSPPSSVASPTGAGCEIQLRNPLLKHAAYAYIQLTPSSIETCTRRRGPLRRFLAAISAAFRPLFLCFGFM